MKNFKQIEKVILEKFDLYNRSIIDNYTFGNPTTLNIYLDATYRGIELGFRKYIASHELEKIEVRYPLNWYEALKERWMPKFLLKYFSIKYSYIKLEAKALYPKILLPDHSHHIVMFKTETQFTIGRDEG